MDSRENQQKNLIRRRMRMRNTGIYAIPRHTNRIKSATLIQRWIKMKLWKMRKRKTINQQAIMIQKVIRGFMGRQKAKQEQQELEMVAAEIIQITYRKYRSLHNRIIVEQTEQCPVCLEQVGIFNSVKLDCEHKICTNCARNLIEFSLANAQSEIPIKCPHFNEDCKGHFTYLHEKAFELCSEEKYRRWEYWEIMKTHISDDDIGYCPYPQCGMPYDKSFLEDSNDNDEFKYRILCPECMSLFCAKCSNIWEPRHVCPDVLEEMNRGSVNESNTYIRNNCKNCPNPACNAIVEKTQTQEQIAYQREKGLSGGTEDCHHMTCTKCKQDFCWTCMKSYRGTNYYHTECPISDCTIMFKNEIPTVIRLPLGTSRVRIKEGNKIEWYTPTGVKIDNPPINQREPTTNSAFMDCDENGVVKSLRGIHGEYTFRQENRRHTKSMSRPVSRTSVVRPNNTDIFAMNNRIQGINRNLNIQPVLGVNRVVNNNVEMGGINRVPTPMPPPMPPPITPPHINQRRNPTHPTLPDIQTNSATDLLNRFNQRRN